jgi:mono/diheme cytochrome c family protein
MYNHGAVEAALRDCRDSKSGEKKFMRARSWFRFASLLAFPAAALVLHGQKKPVDAASRDLDRGEFFFQRDCAACHSIGHYDRIAPDLLGVTRRRDHEWLVHMIQRPNQLLNQQDPIAVALLTQYKIRMPNLRVDDTERDYLIRYFEAQTAAHDKKAVSSNGRGRRAGPSPGSPPK